MSGHLHQEFRDLNLLNNITKKIYEGHISKDYFGSLCNPMIYKYQSDFKIKKETNDWHDALKWNDTEIFIKSPENDETWNIKINKNFPQYMNIEKN